MKKGQIFTLDVVIAIVILIIGIAIIYYTFPIKTKNYYNTERLSEDVISVLQATKITDICVNPGINVSQGCRCQNYPQVRNLVCDERLINREANLLSLMTELIETKRADNIDINNMIREIFVDKNVIDEKRFGFAIIYSKPSADPTAGLQTFELYNTETH